MLIGFWCLLVCAYHELATGFLVCTTEGNGSPEFNLTALD